jgi:AhpD family alkylhydroperoxidase
MPLLRSLPDNATLADLRSRFAELLDKLRPYAERLMRGPSPLTEGERELIAAYVSGINSCRYCHGVHSQVAGAFGIEIATFDKLMTDTDQAEIETSLEVRSQAHGSAKPNDRARRRCRVRCRLERRSVVPCDRHLRLFQSDESSRRGDRDHWFSGSLLAGSEPSRRQRLRWIAAQGSFLRKSRSRWCLPSRDARHQSPPGLDPAGHNEV